MPEKRPMGQSRTIQTKLVLPPDTNHLQTIFGGKVLAYIDEIADIAAMKHSKKRSLLLQSIRSILYHRHVSGMCLNLKQSSRQQAVHRWKYSYRSIR